ncbi:hypothetical protein HER10_EVM0011669 [Colletotrichum scovillei]|uniref:uncharacterized protein n=1 Tax=Colletotrichum scovillei TaxID=1209932 RepID=UPI0015C30EE4|nr:uncharacterized protein HER10_EVM0011669 [Colletotrichum scovillei]KAF4772753.1 hypothetical protein HER10_EVM0011669 [Colletotrichum scovillei]
MAERSSFNRSAGKKTSFTFPLLHPKVANAVVDHITVVWVSKKTTREPNNTYSTSVKGKFTCDNGACSNKTWTSGKVTLAIQGYPGGGYNAVVYNQRCKVCNRLGIFSLAEDTYVDRIAYRLKKWAGVAMERRVYEKRGTPPHKKGLCEGCKKGCCREGFADFNLY